jgi:hypothetical protein
MAAITNIPGFFFSRRHNRPYRGNSAMGLRAYQIVLIDFD